MKTILLIESDDSLRRRFRKFLEFADFRVIALHDEKAACDFLQNQPIDIDLVILGVGPDGNGSLNVLLDELSNTRVLLTTTAESPLMDAPYPFLPKPVPPERLVSKAQQLLLHRTARA
jgi:DNA-binding response OmpR family regulator